MCIHPEWKGEVLQIGNEELELKTLVTYRRRRRGRRGRKSRVGVRRTR
jgi:hypothetical protein